MRNFTKVIVYFFLISSLVSCGIYKPVDTRKVPISGPERAKKNVAEGRGITLGKAIGRGSTNYEFSTSNPLWRASLETIDFMPLTTVDYSGGIIITDWYSDTNNPNQALKITLRFLSNEIQSNSIKVIVHNKKCSASQNCAINEIDTNLKFELQKSILSKAALLEKEDKKSKK